MDCLFKEQEDGLGGMDPFEEGFEEEPEPEPEWADSDVEEVIPVAATSQSKRNLLFEVGVLCYAVLCCAVLCCTVLYCTLLYLNLLYSTQISSVLFSLTALHYTT